MSTPEDIAVDGFSARQRAARIDAALLTYGALVGTQDVDSSTLAGMLADARHWCDVHGVDWYDVYDVALDFYRAEQA